MSVRDRLLPLADKLRSLPSTTTLAGNAGVGVRQETLTIRTRTWDSGIVGQGNATDVDLPIAPNPKMRETRDARGMLVEQITPQYGGGAAGGGGGYTPAQLDPRDGLATGQEVLWIVTGDFDTREYTTAYVDATNATHYTLHLSGLNRGDPY